MFRLFLLFPLAMLHAAPYSVTIEGPFEERLYDIAQDYSGDIAAVGFSEHFATSPRPERSYSDAFAYLRSINANAGEQIRLIRLDATGNTTLDYRARFSEFNRAVSLVKSVDDGYFIGGYTQEGELLIMKLSHHGKTRFVKRFGTKNYDRMHRLVALRDGGVLSVGSSMSSRDRRDGLYEQGLGLNDIYLTRFDKNGHQLWSKKYGTLVDDQGIDAAEAFDGTLLILANSSENKTRGVTLMRLSEEGDKIWLHRYDQEDIVNARRITALRDNHFLAAISYYDQERIEKSRLIKFDLQENMLAEHNVTLPHANIITDIKERMNGSIIAVGYTTDTISTKAAVAAFDPMLAPMWHQTYDTFERSRFQALSILRDGTIAIAGDVVSQGAEQSNMWIVKLYGDGTLASTPFSQGNLYEELCEHFKHERDTGRISITSDLVITLQADTLLFAQGVSRLNTSQENFLKDFGTRLFALLQSHDIKALHVNGHASSEWASVDDVSRYLNNANLSSRRAYHVLSYLYALKQNSPYRPWLEEMLSSDAHSYGQKIMNAGTEDEKKSRRISFKIEGN